MDYAEFLKDFLDDASEHLDTLDGVLLSVERSGPDKEMIMAALGALHTLKGNSGMMGFESLKGYIHLVEEVLEKTGSDIRIEDALDLLLDSANVLRRALRGLAENPDAAPDLADETLAISGYFAGNRVRTGKSEVDPASYLGSRTDTIRVDFKRLDSILDLVGELLIYKTKLNQVESEIRRSGGEKSLSKKLSNGLELMGKTISSLQEGVMKTRMLPVGHVFGKFRRMVRDLSKSQGKEIRLALEGEETELDKTVIDELEEPLLHIVRNAADHGIEDPAERVGAGKDRQGTITLSAAQESNYVMIRVRDDGKGIDVGRVREKAVQMGLIAPDERGAEADGIVPFIFSPGFSTKDEATELSGRGVGLDVVSRRIAKLNGQVSVQSVTGKGATFTIKLPLSLAIIPALMAETCGEVYAIPMNSVDESIKVKEEDIHIINNREVIRFREKVVPVVRLGDFFGLEGRGKKKLYLVMVGRAEKSLALAVDRLRGQQEIVIKPLDDTFGKSEGIAGASILGNGKIVLIVDVMSLWENKTGGNGR